jgi:peroxiredoxin
MRQKSSHLLTGGFLMGFRAARFLAVLGIFVSSPAVMAVEVGDKPSLSFTLSDGKRIDLKDYRGKLVIVDFFSENVSASQDEESHLVQMIKDHADVGVAVIGICLDRESSKTQAFLQKAGVNWPVWFDGKKDLQDVVTQWNHHSFGPVLIGPEGSVLWRGWYAQLDKALADALVNHPPTVIDPDLLAAANASLDTAEKAFKNNDDAAALKALDEIPVDASKNKAFAQRLAEMQPRIQEAISAVLAPADDLIGQHKNLEAIEKLKGLLISFKGTPAEAEINHRLQNLEADPETKSQLQSADSEQKAAAALAEARSLRKDQKVGEAYETLKQIVTNYPGTPSTETAGEMLKSFEADSELMKQVHQQLADAKADGILTLARSYASAGLTEKAKQKFREVIEQFPNTSQSDAAKKEFDALN